MQLRQIENWHCYDHQYSTNVPDPPVVLDLHLSFQDTPEIKRSVPKIESMPIEFKNRKTAVEELRKMANWIEQNRQ